ncbi:MAG: hypothetical protein JNL54_03340 [Kineosporiaceae bacterium]|nr:hypothetical protein [Kineosporiaceae bacterium]
MAEPQNTPSVGDVLADRIRHYRTIHGWSVRALAEQCAAAGATKLTEQALVNLERKPAPGRPRRSVTVEDWLGLALALRVPPLALLMPAKSGEVEVFPGRTMSKAALMEWIAPTDDHWHQDDETPELPEARRVIELLREFWQAVRIIKHEDGAGIVERHEQGLAWGAGYLALSAAEEMRGRGEMPPAAPEDVERLLELVRPAYEEERSRPSRRVLRGGPQVPGFAPVEGDDG